MPCAAAAHADPSDAGSLSLLGDVAGALGEVAKP